MKPSTDRVTGILPLPGKCFVRMLQDEEAVKGGIYIPETALARRRIGFIGTPIAENPTHNTLRGTVGRLCIFSSWAGQRFHHQGLDIVVYDLSLEHFVAVYYKGKWVPLASSTGKVKSIGETGVRRCRYCKSDGQGNILLDGNNVCRRCHRHEDGRPWKPHRHVVNKGTEEEYFVETDLPVPEDDDWIEQMKTEVGTKTEVGNV